MAKKALLDVLESTIGRYVLNLDAKSLNVSVWSGRVDLGGLRLDVDAVNDELSRRAHEAPNLAVPLRVVRGKFDALRVDVPWSRITSRSVVVRASGLDVVVEPYNHLAGSVDVEGKRRDNVRADHLASAEDRRKKLNALFRITAMDRDGGGGIDEEEKEGGREGPAESAGSSFTAKLARRIIENVQVEIENFSVRLRGGGCSVGVELKNMSLVTTDESGNKTFVDRTQAGSIDDVASSFIYKSLAIRGLGLYCDDESVSVYDEVEQEHSYVIAPLTFEASVRQSDLRRCVDFPKYHIQSALPVLSVILTRSQLELTDRITAAFAPSVAVSKPLFPEYRPSVALRRGTARLWWRYAVRCVGRLNRRRSWTEYFLAYKKRKRYVNLYLRSAHASPEASWIKPLSDAEREELKGMEMDQSVAVEGIMLWRNIGDAQAEREKERRANIKAAKEERERQRRGQRAKKAATYPAAKAGGGGKGTTSLFGSSSGPSSEPAVALSPDELKELESATLQLFDETLTSESKLYEFAFALRSFKIDLVAKDDRPLASLDMGTVSTTFDADADGGLSFEFSLSGLEISDRGTPNSVFPLVLQSLGTVTVDGTGEREEGKDDDGDVSSAPEDRAGDEPSGAALKVRLGKSSRGDQDLTVRMTAFEVVASPVLLEGFRDFLSLAPPPPPSEGRPHSLAAGPGDGADEDDEDEEFHDADDGEGGGGNAPSILDITSAAAGAAAGALADNLALAATDAWSRKKMNRKKWTLDCVVHAPVLVVPRSCDDVEAAVIVLDLGRFGIGFGTDEPSATMRRWYGGRGIDDKGGDSSVDVCKMELENMSCFMGTAGEFRLWRDAKTASDLELVRQLEQNSSKIIEPMSGSLEIGVESRTTHSDAAGTCIVGVIPTIGLQITAVQMTSVLGIADSWSSLFSSSERDEEEETLDEQIQPANYLKDQQVLKPSKRNEQQGLDLINVERFHAEVALRRLSAKLVLDDGGNGLEAHLVSMVASNTQRTDGSSLSRLAGGWFWILDNVQAKSPREQRIIAHSELPRPASSFAKNGDYDIMGELERQGVFRDDYAGSSDLAEVTVRTKKRGGSSGEAESSTADTTVEGKFSSLSINYNPLAVQRIIDAVADLGVAKEKPSSESHQDESLRESLITSAVAATKPADPSPVPEEVAKEQAASSIVVSAQMKGLEVMLRSPKDDGPLFLLAMTLTDVKYSAHGTDTEVGLTVRDILCKDERGYVPNQSFVDIVSQCSGGSSAARRGTEEQDLLRVLYTQCGHKSTIGVVVGSPQLILMPDVVEDMLFFVREVSRSDQRDASGLEEDRTKQSDDPLRSSNYSATGAVVEAVSQEDEHGMKQSAGTYTSSLVIKINSSSHCRLVLVDAATAAASAAQQTALSEVVVLQGGFEAGAEMTSDASELVGSSYNISCSWGAVQMFTAQGQDLLSPVQILEPVGLTLCFKAKTHDYGKKQELEMEALLKNKLDAMVSLENVALLQAISTAFGDALAEEENSPTADEVHHTLSKEEASHLKHLASALDKEGTPESDTLEVSNRSLVSQTSGVGKESSVATSRFVKMKATMPEMCLTLINDLQGLDNGLFKVIMKDLSADGEFNSPAGGKQQFKYQVRNSISADYFDVHTNKWEAFLSRPWENRMRAWRIPSNQDKAKDSYMFSTVDIESNPCDISFSEQFLVSLGAAHKMWSTYDFATRKAIDFAAGHPGDSHRSSQKGTTSLIRKSMAAFTARSFVSTLPYAIVNHCGKLVHFELKGESERIACPSGTIQYFRFLAPKGNGVGGKRAYGQDVVKLKALSIFVAQRKISIVDLDAEINRPRQAHHLGGGQFIFTKVARSGRATYVHVSSHVDIFNCTGLGFSLYVLSNGEVHGIGKLEETQNHQPLKDHKHWHAKALGVPVDLLSRFHNSGIPSVEVETSASGESITCAEEDSSLRLSLSTGSLLDEATVSGAFSLPSVQALVETGGGGEPNKITDLLLSPDLGSDNVQGERYSLLVQVSYTVSLVGSKAHPYVSIYLQPQAVLSNQLPITLVISASKLYTISQSMSGDDEQFHEQSAEAEVCVLHELRPNDKIEIFSPNSILQFRAKCAIDVAGGTGTTWTSVLTIPLGGQGEHGLQQPIGATFPFLDEKGAGMPFVISEDNLKAKSMSLQDKSNPSPSGVRCISLLAYNLLIDHTGEVLIEEISLHRSKPPGRTSAEPPSVTDNHDCYSVFKYPRRRRWLTLLPTQGVPMRMLHLTSNTEVRKSVPFCVEDIIFCDGGADVSAIFWETGEPSGYYAYRKFSKMSQSTEIHVVPELVVYNGSAERVLVSQGSQITNLNPGHVAPIRTVKNQDGLSLSFEINGQAFTDPILIDSLGMKVCLVKSRVSGAAIGSLAVQTDIGKSDSRLVVRLGSFELRTPRKAITAVESSFAKDFLRFRFRVEQIQISLHDTQQLMGDSFQRNKAAMEEALGRADNQKGETTKSPPEENDIQNELNPILYSTVAKITLQRLTIDYQRIFREKENKTGTRDEDEQRSQLAFIIRHLQVENCSPNCVYPVVLDSSRTESSVFDLCIRSRDSRSKDSDLVPIDMIDLNLSYSSGKADYIIVQTEEDFMWSLLDVANRTVVATSELAGVDLQLEWNEDTEEYIVSFETQVESQNNSDYETYTAPRSDTLYDIKSARVSPVKLLVSFKRQPQKTRYKLVEKGRGAKLMNYFTTQLSFTIDKAELNFAGYAAKEIKGPPDRLAKMIAAVYTTRLKRKALSLITAVSLKDWNHFTAREDGVDGYVEGDVLRLTGNVAGRSAGFILKKAGQGLGDGVSALTAAIGGEIQYATEQIGVGAVGAGINRAVTGTGAGVGTAVKGVGEGGGKFVRGAGKGAGQIIGGVGGGALLVAQGRLGEGVHAAGYGVGHGVETLVTETAEGVHTVGAGLFGGVKKILIGCCGPCFGGGAEENENAGASQGHCSMM